MKVIITERQKKLLSEDEDKDFLVKKKIAKKQLTKKFGDLIPYETEKHPNYIFYIDENKKIYVEHDKEDGKTRIDYDTIWSFLEGVFSFDYEQTKQVIKEWLEEHYKLSVSRTTYTVNWIDKI